MHEFKRSPLSVWTGRTLSCAVALLGLGWISCGSDPELPPPANEDLVAPGRVEITGGVTAGEFISGQRRLEAVAEDNSGRIVKVSFYISGALACADSEAKSSGSTFSCVWDTSATPPGAYQLTAAALDAAGNTATSMPLSFSVGEANQPPVISATSATPSPVEEDQATALSVTASDPTGDPLTYAWSQVSPASPQGSFNDAATATPLWTAPLLSTQATFKLQVTVSDNKGGSAVSTVDVVVENVASANRAPTVDATITAPASVVSGDSINVSIGATDPDGDALTYSWRTNPAGLGAFTNATASAASWRSAEVTANSPRTVQLQVVVSDGVASVTRSVNVQVTVPSYANHIQTIWDQACISCHDSTNPTGNLNLLPASSYAALYNVNSTNATCNTLRRVRPNLPDSSSLVRKISGTSCGNRMPRDNAAFFDNNPGLVTRIRSWIIAGAPNN
jgi:hypothetical protein